MCYVAKKKKKETDSPKQLERYDNEKFTNDLNEIRSQQNIIIIAMVFHAFVFHHINFGFFLEVGEEKAQ